MTETEFLEASEALMQQVENAVDAAELDVECDRTGNVLTIEADSGEQIVINRHTPTQQMWLATRKWRNTRDGTTFESALQAALNFVCEEDVSFSLD